MHTSIMRASANTVTATRRRRIATVAATLLLAGSVQLLTAESSSACGGPDKAYNPEVPAAALEVKHRGDISSAFLDSASRITPGGSKAEIGTQIANFTGGDFHIAAPALTVTGKGAKLQPKDVTAEVFVNGAWKKLTTGADCYGRSVDIDTSPLLTSLKDGRASRLIFRIGLSAKAPASLSAVSVTLSAWSESTSGKQSSRTLTVSRADAPGKATTAPAAKPTPAKPTPTKPAPAKPAAAPTAAAPAADSAPATSAPAAPATPKSTPTAAPATPKSTPTAAPATTAPAGTPELAQTGADTPNGLLAGIAAALAAVGAGTVIAVRRLRARG
ncbi:hypothetical protein [Kitasatospora sp. NPDC057500]|uniref:hypothetical protein n=1 Tax=Kitasatospora sp. NPDC057500 TaxID=3346151 RepID=UPI0036C37CB1